MMYDSSECKEENSPKCESLILKSLQSRADKGNAEAAYQLGVIYYWDYAKYGIIQNESLAATYWKQAADANHLEACYEYSVCYKRGTGFITPSEKWAEHYANKALTGKWHIALIKKAKEGGAPSQYHLGRCYEYGVVLKKDTEQAVDWYRKAAEQGLAQAQCNLGVIYAEGQGVEKDDKEAVSWYRKAAEQGYAQAQCNLGVIYAEGQGVEKDDKEAVSWFKKAAKQGLAQAQDNLSEMYAEGQGVEKDNAKAVSWFGKAVKQGYCPPDKRPLK